MRDLVAGHALDDELTIGIGRRLDTANLQHHLHELWIVRPLERPHLDRSTGDGFILIVDDHAGDGSAFAQFQQEVIVNTAIDYGEFHDVARRHVSGCSNHCDAAGANVLEFEVAILVGYNRLGAPIGGEQHPTDVEVDHRDTGARLRLTIRIDNATRNARSKMPVNRQRRDLPGLDANTMHFL